MIITRDNYESFFLDYLEDNLKEELIDQFLDFLQQNPDLKEELHLFDHFNLPEEKIVFSGKSQLHKKVADEKSALENKFIACLEGDLEDQEHQLFEVYLACQPDLQKEYNLFAKTRLIPDSAIKFPGKHRLKRKSRPAILMNWIVSTAAVFLLLWGISSVIPTGNPTKLQQANQVIAEIKPTPVSPLENVDVKKKPTGSKQNLNPIKFTNTLNTENIQKLPGKSPEENVKENSSLQERDLTALTKITPILAQLELIPIENQLAIFHSRPMGDIYKAPKIMSLDEFLASKAKKVSNEGLLSAKRMARAGLSVASELSGERIGYVEKNGKIESIEFEGKLFAFSIPLTKR